MKKIIYTLLIIFATSLTITSCSEEEIKPNTDEPTAPVTAGADKGF